MLKKLVRFSFLLVSGGFILFCAYGFIVYSRHLFSTPLFVPVVLMFTLMALEIVYRASKVI